MLNRLDDLRATITRDHRVLCTDTSSATELIHYLNRGREYWRVVAWQAVSDAGTAAEFEEAWRAAPGFVLPPRHRDASFSWRRMAPGSRSEATGGGPGAPMPRAAGSTGRAGERRLRP